MLRDVPEVTEQRTGERLKHRLPGFVSITTSLHGPSLEGRGLLQEGGTLGWLPLTRLWMKLTLGA